MIQFLRDHINIREPKAGNMVFIHTYKLQEHTSLKIVTNKLKKLYMKTSQHLSKGQYKNQLGKPKSEKNTLIG